MGEQNATGRCWRRKVYTQAGPMLMCDGTSAKEAAVVGIISPGPWSSGREAKE